MQVFSSNAHTCVLYPLRAKRACIWVKVANVCLYIYTHIQANISCVHVQQKTIPLYFCMRKYTCTSARAIIFAEQRRRRQRCTMSRKRGAFLILFRAQFYIHCASELREQLVARSLVKHRIYTITLWRVRRNVFFFSER